MISIGIAAALPVLFGARGRAGDLGSGVEELARGVVGREEEGVGVDEPVRVRLATAFGLGGTGG